MMKAMSACAAVLFATSAWAAEAETGPAPAAEEPPVAQAAPAALASPTQPQPEPAKPEPPAAAAAAPASSETPPYIGWGRGLRAPIYVNLMLSAGALGEDGGNRLTTRSSKILEGGGGVFRIGAVINQHHRLGGRLQSFIRPTKKVEPDPASTAVATDSWGAVTFGYAGPEYLYTDGLGFYGGGSLGVAGAVSSRKTDVSGSDTKNHREKAALGVAAMLSAGYEWRANKWFAMNAELYGGLYHLVDDNEDAMNGSIFGVAMGVGF
jgi:hypothetical protein